MWIFININQSFLNDSTNLDETWHPCSSCLGPDHIFLPDSRYRFYRITSNYNDGEAHDTSKCLYKSHKINWKDPKLRRIDYFIHKVKIRQLAKLCSVTKLQRKPRHQPQTKMNISYWGCSKAKLNKKINTLHSIQTNLSEASYFQVLVSRKLFPPILCTNKDAHKKRFYANGGK